jgi:hypothetical protein
LLSYIIDPSVPPLTRSDMPKSQLKIPDFGGLIYRSYNHGIALRSEYPSVGDIDELVSSVPTGNELCWESVEEHGEPNSQIRCIFVGIVSHA